MNLATIIAGLRTQCLAHIDLMAYRDMVRHGVAVAFLRRSVGQKFRWILRSHSDSVSPQSRLFRRE